MKNAERQAIWNKAYQEIKEWNLVKLFEESGASEARTTGEKALAAWGCLANRMLDRNPEYLTAEEADSLSDLLMDVFDVRTLGDIERAAK